MNTTGRWMIFAVGAVLLLSSGAHAFLGWPQIRLALTGSMVDPQLIAALSVGWHYGSVAMAAFGLIVLILWWRLGTRGGGGEARGGASGAADAGGGRAGAAGSRAVLLVIAAAYVAFGTAALLYRDLQPHFLLFIIPGLVLGVGAFMAGRR